MISHVARNPRAIGWEIPWFALKQYASEGAVKTVKMLGMDPQNLDFLARGEYPLYRTFNLTTWTDRTAKSPKAEELVRYLMKYVEEHGAEYWIVPASKLKETGWQFRAEELVGSPQ
jgi:hypothetical protein